MPIRRPPPSSKEEEVFVPPEPWWRKASSVDEPKRKTEREPRRYQEAVPRVVDRGLPRLLPSIRLPGRLIAFVLITIAVLGGLMFLLTSDLFTVTRAETTIRGTQRIMEDAVYAASLVDGMNIFQIRSEQVVGRIRAIEGIADTAVHVRLPDKVLIDIREQAPLVAWQAMTGTLWIADSGAILPAGGDPPVLRLVDEQGSARDAGGKLRADVLTSLKELQSAGLEVTDLYYGKQEGLYFVSPEGWTVYLGHAGKMDAKLTTLRELRNSSAARNLRKGIVDLRYDGRVQLK
jgi:cell division septal protein FtsQ